MEPTEAEIAEAVRNERSRCLAIARHVYNDRDGRSGFDDLDDMFNAGGRNAAEEIANAIQAGPPATLSA